MSTLSSVSRPSTALASAIGAALLVIAVPACTQSEEPQERTVSVQRDPLVAEQGDEQQVAVADRTEGELADATVRARAVVRPTANSDVQGTVDFYFTPAAMAIQVNLTGLKPGTHGFHIHETGDCGAPDASSAGPHLNPDDRPHGAPTEANAKRHAGDLGNIRADADGTSKQWLRNEQLQLDGPAGILGRAVIVHAHDDDLESQPAGASGEPVACGVIAASVG